MNINTHEYKLIQQEWYKEQILFLEALKKLTIATNQELAAQTGLAEMKVNQIGYMYYKTSYIGAEKGKWL